MVLSFSMAGTLFTFADTGVVRFEAENATRNNTYVVTDQAGYSGTGFVNHFGNVGNSIEFTVTGSVAGSQDITVYYATATGITLNLYVNNVLVGPAVLATTGGWGNWTPHTDVVTLNAGTNTIKYQKDDAAGTYLNLDYLAATVNVVPVTGVTMSSTTLSMTDYSTSQLTATVAPADASNKILAWTSSNTAVATVDLNGLVTTLTPGETTITATSQNGGFTATCVITVTSSGAKKYEAENATLNGLTYSNNHSGYSGTGFVDNTSAVGRYVEFAITNAPGGSQDISLKYANNTGGDRTMALYVNGTKVRNVTFPNINPNWDTWGLKVENVTLNAGNNTIKYQIDNGNTAQINIDFLLAPFDASITTEVSKGLKESNISISPNPLTSGLLSIKLPEDATQLSIFDVTGRIVYQKQVSKTEYLIDQSVFKSQGIYVVNVLTTKKSLNQKVIVTK